jgi:hypothetical protein
MKNKLVILIFSLIFSSTVFAYCSEPSTLSRPPTAPASYEKPSVPYCLIGYKFNKKHTCNKWEVDSYINSINEYVRKLRDYAEESKSYANKARVFANNAIDYANCESEEASAELK